MTVAVLDTSALVALMLKEPGAEVVAAHLDGAIISTVNLAEVGAKMVERGATLDLVETEVRAADIAVIPFEEAHALETARLRPATRNYGLSLGDRACLALAGLTQGFVLTSDREWTEVGLPLDIRLIR
ncbi:MAG: type II toxin-antitoxin system VapC family toxin [Pseudomonadota bacterium]|nr:type II toxin-antitoxin system VapC family toxin [Pseudomonadota bacterium]